ncbi:DUF4349 domain-containing protein [Leucobacter viscericola]|uniref:DUF4349 domain-containing protein n=1 Tax=Leucobacter viscericola TaxID=2714935 RepID=A0A6G7XDU3_9MICO|nr:DUF4349 domain-containing protein [Leucobacter viscericola]QIK62567.1 DUF4349 domain-containing protein [Leucobacter viscericola]
MKRHGSLLALVAAALLIAPLSACAANPSSIGDTGGGRPASESTAESGAPLDASQKMTDSAPEAGQSVIQNGDLTIVVADPTKSADRVTAVAEKLGGYVESQTISKASGSDPASASLSLRVPSAKVDEAFDALAEVGNVTSQNRSATDVTAQHVDLKARVAALEDSVTRLKELMSGAATTGELIEAETALSQRQQELDGLKAQLKALEDQVDEATIWVSLTTDSVIPGGPSNFWDGLLAGIASLGAAGAGALVVLGILLPWLVLGGIIALIVIAIVRSRRRAKTRRGEAQPTAIPPAEHTTPTTENM